jgi:hypothetical protein
MIRPLVFSIVVALSVACAEDTLVSYQQPSEPLAPTAEPPLEVAEPPVTCQEGAIMGRLCLPGTNSVLAGATVTLQATNCLGETKSFEVPSDDTGRFNMIGLPEGEHTFTVNHVSQNGSFSATVQAGEIVTVSATQADDPVCLELEPSRYAVIGGIFDEVEKVLDSMDLAYDLYESDSYGYGSAGTGALTAFELLTDPALMSGYDAIFVNCGSQSREFLASTTDYDFSAGNTVSFDYNHAVYANLKTFVAHGGNVYASDWAWPIAEGIDPTAVDFYGDEDTNGSDVLIGDEGVVTANILDTDLELFMGTNQVPIDFDLMSWAVMEEAGSSNTNVVVRGDFNVSVSDPNNPWSSTSETIVDKPLLVRFKPFVAGGYVIYTSFHYERQANAQMLDVLRFLLFQL